MCQRAGEREEARAAECEEERGEELGSTGQSYTRTRRKQKSSRNRNQNSHSFWTRRERGKTCPKLRQTHWEGKEHFCWKKTPNSTTMSHLQTPKPTTTSHCPQVTPLSLGSRCGGACRPHERAGEWESSTLPAWKCNGSQEKGEASEVTSIMANTFLPSGLLGKGTKFPRDCQLPLARRGCSREGSVRRERVNCPRSLLSLPGLWNNQR